AAFGARQADLEGLGTSELLDARFAEVEAVDPATQLLDVNRLREGDADQLPADEIDAEVEPAIDREGDRDDRRQQRQGQRQVAPAHEVHVGVVGDELEQLHVAMSLRCGARAGGYGGSTAPPACG